MNTRIEQRRFINRLLGCTLLLAVSITAAPLPAQTPPTQPTLFPTPSMVVGTVAVGSGPSVVAINPATHKVYVANENDETLTVIDGFSLKTIATLPIGTGFHALAVNPVTNRIYVASLGSSELLVLDGAKDTLIAEVGVQSAPDAVVVDSGTNTIYVANNASNSLSVVNGTTNAVMATLSAGVHPEAIALNYVNHKLYIASYDGGTVTVIDTANGNATTTINGLGLQQYAIAVDPNTDCAFVLSETSGNIVRIDGAHGYATLVYSNMTEPFSVVVDPTIAQVATGDKGDKFVAFLSGSNDERAVYNIPLLTADAMAFDSVTSQIDIVSHQGFAMVLNTNEDPMIFIYEQFATGNQPFAIAVDPVTHRSFISNQADGTLTVLDGSAQLLFNTPSSVTMQASAVDVNPVSSTLYFVNTIYQTLTAVSEIPPQTGNLHTATIPIGNNASSVAVNPVTNKIYVPNLADGTITVVDGETNLTTFVTGLPKFASPNAAVVNPTTNRVYFSDVTFSDVYVIDGHSDSVITTLATGPCEFSPMTINPLTNKIYIPCYSEAQVVVIDEISGQVTAVPLPGAIYLAVNTMTNQVFVFTQSATQKVVVMDGGSNQIIGSFATTYGPTGIGVNPLTNKVYVIADNPNDGSGHTLVYDGASYALLQDVPTTSGPNAVSVNPLSNLVYVSGTNNNYLTVIDGASDASEILFTDGSNLISTGGSDALAVDLALDIVSAAGKGEVSALRMSALFYPTPTLPSVQVPVATTLQGVVDKHTIATTPLYRTSGTSVSFVLTAQSNYANPAMVPQQIFYQLDGWQGAWQKATLTSPPGANPATANASLSLLTGGLHYLYAYVVMGDAATVHGSTFAENSSVISAPQGVVFSVEPATQPGQISVVSGSNQTTAVGTAFGAPLVALVLDSKSNPMPGATVTFSAPVSGAGAVFSGLTTTTVVTDNSGKATSPIPTANSTAGTYAVTASVGGVATPADFTLTNSNSTGVATLSPTSLSFGSVALTGAKAKNVKLTNTGTGSLKVTSLTASGDFSEVNNCPGTLTPSAFCTIRITFTPTVVGAVPGAFTAGDDAANSPQMVTLSGTGVTVITVKPASLKFGATKVGTTSAAQTISVTNNSAGTLSPSFSASTEYAAAAGATSPCGSTLATGASCNISVTFTPKQNGTIAGSVSLTAPSLPIEVVSVVGSGSGGVTIPPVFKPATLTFSPQVLGTTSDPQTVTFTNPEKTGITISSLIPSADYTAAGSGTSPCGGSLAGHAACTFAVSFTPSVAGKVNGSVAVSNSSPINPVMFNMTGTGVNPVTLSPATLTFSAQSVGTTSAPQTITLTNNQTLTLTIDSVTGSGDYAVVSGGSTPCGATVLAGASCTLQATFTPSNTGTINGAATVTHSANGSPQMVGLTGTGK